MLELHATADGSVGTAEGVDARVVSVPRMGFGVVFVVAVLPDREGTLLYMAIDRIRGVSTTAWFFDLGVGTGVRVTLGRA